MDDVKLVAKILVREKGYLVAKIEQGHKYYLNMMIDKYLTMGWEVKGNMIVIDSFNGALYLSTNAKKNQILFPLVHYCFILIVLLWVLVLLLILVF